MKVLMIDVGGTSVKFMTEGQPEFRKLRSGPRLSAAKMVKGVLSMTQDWDYDAITLGFPGLVRNGKISREPLNLGSGWVGFNFQKAFRKPVRIINDAAMQALANYKSGRMLFMGLGTSVGATLIVDDVVIPLEIGILRLTKAAGFMDKLGKDALNRDGKTRWKRSVMKAVELLQDAFWPDHFVIGGGNAKHLDPVPKGCECGSNHDAYHGAVRMWPGADMLATPVHTTWRLTRTASKRKKSRRKKS